VRSQFRCAARCHGDGGEAGNQNKPEYAHHQPDRQATAPPVPLPPPLPHSLLLARTTHLPFDIAICLLPASS
jgi:hypothetical protein